MGDGDEVKPDADLIALLQRQDGIRTEVALDDGRRISVWNIAWGYDLDDEYAHITTNCSPFVGQEPLDFFFTNEVVEVRQPGSDDPLFVRDR